MYLRLAATPAGQRGRPAGMTRRRIFLRACAAGLFLARSARAQRAAKTLRVGFLTYATPEQSTLLLREFTDGLREFGYVDGRTIVIEPHYGDGTLDHLPDQHDPPRGDLPIEPIYTNIFAPPLPQHKRFVQLGQTMRKLI